MTTARRTGRARKASRIRSYLEPEYDSEYDTLSETTPLRQSARLQVAQGDNSDAESSPASSPAPGKATRIDLPIRKPTRPEKRKTRSATASKSGNKRGRKKGSRPSTRTSHRDSKRLRRNGGQKLYRASETIPRWQTLPYQILVKIMKHASYPLYSGSSHDSPSTKWLLKLSTLCRAFHEACLGALLCSPPLIPAHRAHGLVRLLQLSEEEYGRSITSQASHSGSKITTDYRTKVQSLVFDTDALLGAKSGLQIAEILRCTVALRSLVFYHHHDFFVRRYLWAQPNHSGGKNTWQYTQLYPILDLLPARLNLRHFEWNARFLTKDDGLLLQFLKVHRDSRHFDSLESVTFRNFTLSERVIRTIDVGDPSKKATLQQHQLATWRSALYEVLSRLENLTELYLCDSNIFDAAFVSSIPNRLTKLVIVNCLFVQTDGLGSYLSTKGSQLRELILKANQSLSLDFAVNLGQYTPKLSNLEVELMYNDPTSFQDKEPLFDNLVPNGPPTWPASLQRIVMGPLRQLSTEDAEAFFQSLVDASDSLANLRMLEIRALLTEVGWRERAALRAKWSHKFDRTFSVNQNPRFPPPSATHSHQSQDSERSRSQRLRQAGRHIQLSDSESNLSSSVSSSFFNTYEENGLLAVVKNPRGPSVGRNGRCHTVLFELSDQRPAQDQFTVEDFIDG